MKKAVGFDLSKEGVYAATAQPVEAFWCVADLTNLPFEDQTFTTILNIFSPSHYKEFQRVLTDDGEVLKIVPQQDYLKELRKRFIQTSLRNNSIQMNEWWLSLRSP